MMMVIVLMMFFQGLRHPAPFSDNLEPVDKPYKRVSMDEAKQGTSREWQIPKKCSMFPKFNSQNCPHASTKYKKPCDNPPHSCTLDLQTIQGCRKR